MKLLPKTKLGDEDETGFHLVDDPSRDFSFIDEQRARAFRQCIFVITMVVLTALAGLAYYHFFE